LANIAENEDIADIDFTYASFGVSLNVKENACKKYIYKFLKVLLGTAFDSEAYEAWRAYKAEVKLAQDEWALWALGQGNEQSPYFGRPEPQIPPEPPIPGFQVEVRSANQAYINYNMIISWAGLAEETGLGQRKPGAKKGDLWWEVVAQEEFRNIAYNGFTGFNGFYLLEPTAVATMALHWQETDNSWRSMICVNLAHINQVYKGRGIRTSAYDAFMDVDESGFIIPLHQQIFREISLIDATQMATASSFLVFNCYVEKKKKWYQSFWFQVIIIIVITVVAVYTGYVSGETAGLLGTNVAVGTALGFTGMAAIVAGAAANAIAAMILVSVIQEASTALFGEKWGAIIGMIAGIIVVNVGTSMSNGQGWAAGFTDLLKADNIMKLTAAAGNGYAEYMQANAMEFSAQAKVLEDSYEEMTRQNQAMYADNIGYGNGVIDPMNLTDAAQQLGFTPESLDSFLSRTLMTGSEIAELSQELLYNFTELTLTLDLPK
jgi:hypothetical protein